MSLKRETELHLKAHHRDFEEFAKLMEETHKGRFDEVFWGFIRTHLKSKPVTIADLGTGPGLLIKDLAVRFSPRTLYAVEAQPSMLKRAHLNAKNVEETSETKVQILEHDLTSGKSTTIHSGSTDLVIASMVLHEILVPTTVLDEASRILKPGGLLIVYDWIRQPLEHYFEMQRPSTLDDFTHFSEHCRYTPEDLVWLIKTSGFTPLEWIARHDGRHVLIAAEKNTTEKTI